MKNAWAVSLVLLIAACIPPLAPRLPAPPQLPRTTVKYERMALFMNGADIARLRGFLGAAPAGYTVDVIRVSDGVNVAQATADASGRFDVEFAAAPDAEFELKPHSATEEATPLLFKARDRFQAAKNMVSGRLAGTGSTPNQIVVDAAGDVSGATRAVVVLSGDNAVQGLDVDQGTASGVFASLPDTPGVTGVRTANPWNAAVRGDLVYVTRYGQGGVSAINLATGAARGTVDPVDVVTLAQTLTLNPPADADGNGTPETLADALLPRSPTGIAIAGNRLLVAYANILTQDGSGFAQYGPGMLAAAGLRDDGQLDGTLQFVQTAFKNPQHVVVMPDGQTVLLASSGALQRVNGAWLIDGDSGVEVYDASTLQKIHTFNLGAFAPGRPLVLQDGNSVYVPSILRGRIARMNISANQLVRGPGGTADSIITEQGDALRTTFECALHGAGLAFCGTFDTDSLTVLDTADDTVRPWPFSDDISIRAPGTSAQVGVQSLAVRPGRNGVDRTGTDIVVLASLASQVVALDTRFVLGP